MSIWYYVDQFEFEFSSVLSLSKGGKGANNSGGVGTVRELNFRSLRACLDSPTLLLYFRLRGWVGRFYQHDRCHQSWRQPVEPKVRTGTEFRNSLPQCIRLIDKTRQGPEWPGLECSLELVQKKQLKMRRRSKGPHTRGLCFPHGSFD